VTAAFQSALELAAGSEILVVDADPKVRAGIEQLLREVGMQVTALADDARAGKLVGERFYAVVVVDLDTPSPGDGIALVPVVKERSPASAVIMMSSRKLFEAAVWAFRNGASDIIAKAPDQVEYLRHRVIELAAESRVDLDRRKLLAEALECHEDFLRRMMETARKVNDLEERLAGRSPSSPQLESVTTCVLVVDEQPTLYEHLNKRLAQDAAWWRVRHAQTGGEALDLASNEDVHVALIKETLPDLPGKMVVKTLAKTSPQTLTVVFAPDRREAHLFEGSRVIPLEMADAEQAVLRVQELRDAVRARNRERRYLQAFRAQHYDFLRKYAELKGKIERVSPRGK
jgi:DNA-binding NtrC family response regulator